MGRAVRKYGSSWIYEALTKAGKPCGTKRIERLMNALFRSVTLRGEERKKTP
jgi:hypothetical protein